MNEINYYKKAKFIKSVVNFETDAPSLKLNEVLFVGRSNVGKSSLINAITNNSKLAFVSSKPGHTRLLNYYLIDDLFYLVDAPGYGFSSEKGKDYKFYGDMLENYLSNNPNLKVVIFLLDSRRIPNEEDVMLYDFLKINNIPFIIVMTKADKANMSERSKIEKNLIQSFNEFNKNNYFLVSIKNGKLLNNFIDKLNQYVKR